MATAVFAHRMGFGASPTALQVCRYLTVWRVCWYFLSFPKFAAVEMHRQLIPSPHTQQIFQSRSTSVAFPWDSRNLRLQNCSGNLIQRQNCTPVITSLCLAELQSGGVQPTLAAAGRQGCHQPGVPMPCTPGKKKGSIINEAGF